MTRGTSCAGWDGTVLWISFGLIFVGLAVFVFFSFLNRRRRLKKNCCCGTPGLFPPLDFLTGHPSRLVLTLTLMALSGHVVQNTILQPVLFTDRSNTVSQIISAVVRLGWIVYAAFLFLPSVTCSATVIPIIGYTIGSLYTGLLIVWYALWVHSFRLGCLYFSTEITVDTPEISTTVVGITPVILCLAGVLIWYVVSLVKEIWKKIKGQSSWIQSHPTLHFNSYKYLKFLLNKEKTLDNRKDLAMRSGVLHKIKNKIYTNRPGFAYPLRLIVSLGGASIVLFELSFLLITQFLTITDNILMRLDTIANNSCNDPTSIMDSTNNTLLCDFLEYRQDIIIGFSVFLIMGPFIAFPFSLLQLLPILKNARTHLLQGFKGDKSFIPKGVEFSPSFIIASTIKYPGYQIGYIVLGWMLYALTVWLFGVLLLAVVFAFVYAYAAVLLIISSIILTIIINIFIQVLINVTCKFVFVEEKGKEQIILTNKRLYHITSYLLYCYNGLLGLGSSIGRMVFAAGQGLVLAPRLDISGMKKPNLDKGHLTYLGFIQLELIQNNAIVHVFVDILSESVKERNRNGQHKEKFNYLQAQESGENRRSVTVEINGGSIEELESYSEAKQGHSSTIVSATVYDLFGGSRPRVSQRAFNRWHLAYMLMKNPSIRNTRSCTLNEFK
ncbi:PREDICTED: stimulated by retinoic acid gene 6 protein homolog [Amphimedon queenslandica]|uniref:Receptor for retinol uptake STRA6 n=1 Tax=Amphimedon queenslandica TaxID=400682 RepID=A0A1X7UTZ9_AMPQE|nr:PREDICTED: stimulated by retinoic acid gene 6 protein homolog [Amphimedon queenslandica]|eukprot:XP_011404141.2 PREDICTED: stimulated by retinoic acid gene 6 protein homolog [Amphimedon queenslandica]